MAIQSNDISINVLDPLFRIKNVDKKRNFSESLVIPKRKSMSTKFVPRRQNVLVISVPKCNWDKLNFYDKLKANIERLSSIFFAKVICLLWSNDKRNHTSYRNYEYATDSWLSDVSKFATSWVTTLRSQICFRDLNWFFWDLTLNQTLENDHTM